MMADSPFMFSRNYPLYETTGVDLLTTPQRAGALPDYTGRGVVMAFLDSGFYPHPDIRDRILTYVDASTQRIVEGRLLPNTHPFNWHGQMTSVIAAGNGTTSGGKYRGIACDAQLVLIKVTSPRGAIKEADILRGMTWLVRNARRYNVRVANISVGGDFPSDDPDHPLYKAVRALNEAGVTVLIAAGNSGSQPVPPASAVEAITVGAVNDQNSLDQSLWKPYNNSFGTAYDGSPKPDIIAPGSWIASPIMPTTSVEQQSKWLIQLLDLAADDEAGLSRILTEGMIDLKLPPQAAQSPDKTVRAMLQAKINEYKLVDSQYQHVDGTSVSVAIVSSVVAQMLEANPGLTPAQVKAILMDTAKPLSFVPPEQQGAGLIDSARAVTAASTLSIDK